MPLSPDASTVAAWLVGTAALITAIVIIWRASASLARGARKLSHFFDDWFGEASRPGQDARPGFPDRLSGVESSVSCMSDQVATIAARVERVEAQVHPNGGSSMRDAVARIEKRTTQQQPPGAALHQTFVNPGDLSGDLNE